MLRLFRQHPRERGQVADPYRWPRHYRRELRRLRSHRRQRSLVVRESGRVQQPAGQIGSGIRLMSDRVITGFKKEMEGWKMRDKLLGIIAPLTCHDHRSTNKSSDCL